MAIVILLVFLSIVLIGYASLVQSVEAIETRSDRIAQTTDTTLRSMFLFADTRRLMLFYVAALIGVPAALLMGGQSFVVAIVAFVLILIAPRFVLNVLAERRRDAINRTLPDALGQIAGSMRAGATFTSAVQSMVEEQSGPLGQEFGLLLREQRVGARLDEALDNLGERVQTEEMDLVITATMIAQEVGGNLAEILQRLSDTLRRKLEMEGKIKSLTAQGILQGRVVTALPFMIMVALLFLEPEAIRPLFSSLLGWCFLVVIVIMQITGGLVIRKIVRIPI